MSSKTYKHFWMKTCELLLFFRYSYIGAKMTANITEAATGFKLQIKDNAIDGLQDIANR